MVNMDHITHMNKNSLGSSIMVEHQKVFDTRKSDNQCLSYFLKANPFIIHCHPEDKVPNI